MDPGCHTFGAEEEVSCWGDLGLGCGSRFWAENEGFTKGPGLAPSSFSYIASHTWRFGGRQRGGAGKRTVEKVSCTQ